MQPSIGTVGDAFDNALAETTIGLYKTECTRPGSPFRTGPLARVSDIEEVTSAWVHWYNTARLMHRLGRRPPTEHEADYYAQTVTTDRSLTRNEVCAKPGTVQTSPPQPLRRVRELT